MPDAIESRLLLALERLRQLDREMHLEPVGSDEHERLARRVAEQRLRVKGLIGEMGDAVVGR